MVQGKADAATSFRCGDHVKVLWEGVWYTVRHVAVWVPRGASDAAHVCSLGFCTAPARTCQRGRRACTLRLSASRPAPTPPRLPRAQGVVSDCLSSGKYCVTYSDGAFEAGVSSSVLKHSSRRPALPKLDGKLPSRKRNELLRDMANAGEAAAVEQLLRDGADPAFMDSQSYTPLHWASGP